MRISKRGQALFTGREGLIKKRRVEQHFKYCLDKTKHTNGFLQVIE